jgi:hypothetical protein
VPDKRWEIVVAVILLALIAVSVFAPWIFLGRAFYWGDIGLFFLPLNHFLKASLASGTIPLWNPYLFCGAPYVGNPQVSVVYPSTLLLPLFPAVTSIMIAETAHIFAAGVFFWLFARRGSLKLKFLPALFSACVYMLCGYFVAKAQFPNMLAALAYVPLLLYQTELLVLEPSIRRTVIFGAAFGMELLAAHTQIAVFALYLMVPYAFLVYYASPVRYPFTRVLFMGLAGGLFAAGLSCCYWLPVAELIHSSARQSLSLKVANRFYLPVYELGNFVFPHLHGSPMRGDWSARGNYWETDNYVGIFPILLMLLYCYASYRYPDLFCAQKIQRKFWAVVLVVSVWLSLGINGGLYCGAFFVLPALKAFHDPARLMLGANIAIALFAGAGLQTLLRWQTVIPRYPAALLILVITVCDLGWHDRGIYPLKPVSQIQNMRNAPLASAVESSTSRLGGGRILMPDSHRTWQSFTTYKRYESNDLSYMREWPDTLSPCLGMTYSVRDVSGYDPEYRRDSQELVDLAQRPLNNMHDKGILPSNISQYLGMLGVQYLVTYRVNRVKNASLIPVLHSDWTRQHKMVTIYKNMSYVGRAAVCPAWTNVGSQEDAMAAFSNEINTSTGDTAFTLPVVEGLSQQPTSAAFSSAQTNIPVKFVEDEPDDIKLLTPKMTAASVLVLADTMHPGWTVYVDHRPGKIYRANVDQRAVYLPSNPIAAQHTIEFRYRPTDFLVGLYGSLLSLSFFLSVFLGFNRTLLRRS